MHREKARCNKTGFKFISESEKEKGRKKEIGLTFRVLRVT